WIDEYGDRDGDGFVEYERRTDRGLENQSWKDSGDSQRFHDGSIARGPIAPCEVQGYVYDAKRRLAEMAREVWRDVALAERLEQEAADLRDRFDDALFSGWGVRTMSTGDAAYNPLSYHNGTVWPHDNSLIAWGLARHARWPEAHRIVRAMFDASGALDHQLPEVFAGLPRSETPFP